MKIRLIFLSLLLSVCFGNLVSAQQKGVGVQTVSKLPAKEKRWALIIGVSQYQDGNITPLPGANNDARGLRDALRDYAGFDEKQIILLTTDESKDRQPTKNNILRYLGNLKGLVPKDGLLFVAFSGHGIERQNRAFLLASDTPYNDNVKVLERTALSVSDDFKELIRDTEVGQVVILLDACRNDPSSGRSSSDNLLTKAYEDGFSFDVRNREVEAFATLYATSIGARAYEYTRENKGYFTWAFIEGLKGGAANSDGEVTLGALIHYVEKYVPQQVKIDLGSSKLQRPFSIIEGYKAEELVLGIAKKANQIKRTPSSVGRTREAEFWQSIEKSTDAADFETYLAKCRNREFSCAYKVTAELKLKQLKASDSKSKMISWEEVPLVKGKIVRKYDASIFGENYSDSIHLPEEIAGFRTAKKYKRLVMKVGIQDNREAEGGKRFRVMDENGTLFEEIARANRRPVVVDIDISDSDVIAFTNYDTNSEPPEFVRYLDVAFEPNPNPPPIFDNRRINNIEGISWTEIPLVKGKIIRKTGAEIFGEKYPNSIHLLEEATTFRTAKKYKKLVMLVGVQDNGDARGRKNFSIKDENGKLFEGEARPNRRPVIVEIDIGDSDLITFSNYDTNGEPADFIRYMNVIFVPK